MTVTPNTYIENNKITREVLAYDEEGNEYRLEYYVPHFLNNIELGKTYTFYGIILKASEEMPGLMVEYMEKLR